MEENICPRCGETLDQQTKVCPRCGGHGDLTDGSEAKEKKKRKGWIFALIAAAAVILIVAVVLGIVLGRRTRSEAYYADMETAFTTMLTGATLAENTGNLIISVWYNAIWEERDAETDPYTMENGDFVADFSIALDKLYADADFGATLSAIKANRDDVYNWMQALRDPPKKYKQAYEALCNLYDQYWKLTGAAIDSSGSYNSYTEAFENYDTATADAVDQFARYHLKARS